MLALCDLRKYKKLFLSAFSFLSFLSLSMLMFVEHWDIARQLSWDFNMKEGGGRGWGGKS